jgi:hypothetical protein
MLGHYGIHGWVGDAAMLDGMTTSATPVDQCPDMAFFVERGYAILPSVLSRDECAGWRRLAEGGLMSDEQLAGERRVTEEAARFGTMIHSHQLEFLAPLIGHQEALARLREMGFEDIRLWKANLISKPPGGRRLPWHQDGMMWNDERSYSWRTQMMFLMYYLSDTTRENGCLRVIPGSHRRRHPLHDAGIAHDAAFYAGTGADDPRLADAAEEIDVPMRSGDLLIGDARMLHATHANRTGSWRSVVTIWYYPWFSDLLPESRRWITDGCNHLHAGWSGEAKRHIVDLWPQCVERCQAVIDRSPGIKLR